LIKTLLMNIYDFVKFLTNFKKNNCVFKTNFKSYFNAFKTQFYEFLHAKNGINSFNLSAHISKNK